MINYQVLTDGHSNNGIDEKGSYHYYEDAYKSCQEYLDKGYKGTAIYSFKENRITATFGNFRKEIV